jgi:hypothetical protein
MAFHVHGGSDTRFHVGVQGHQSPVAGSPTRGETWGSFDAALADAGLHTTGGLVSTKTSARRLPAEFSPPTRRAARFRRRTESGVAILSGSILLARKRRMIQL